MFLDPQYTDPQRLKRQRSQAQALKKSQWWLDQRNRGLCHYCGQKVSPKDITMDHIIPLARGGESKKGNIVASCQNCNQKKKLSIPAEAHF